MILPRSWQNHPTAKTMDVTPTNVGPPSPNSTLMVLKHEVPLAINQEIGSFKHWTACSHNHDLYQSNTNPIDY